MSKLDLEKKICFFFEKITQIPHGSGEEKEISDYLVSVAKEHNLKFIQDDSNNVIIYKDASQGYEDHPSVILQAHIDMVNEKNSDSSHDFSKDPLELIVDGDILKANGTTLGADDGAGVAYILSILTDTTCKHPRIIGLFTVNEEATMEGAFNLDVAHLEDARRLINIDGEEENSSITGSAGGMDIVIHHPVKRQSVSAEGYRIQIKGLLGGHSGGEIHKERGNSVKVLARLLHHLTKQETLMLSSIQGGLKINAIPREAEATFTISKSLDEVQSLLEVAFNDIKKELEFTDPDITLDLETTTITSLLDEKTSSDIITYLYLTPTGLRHKSDHLDGLTTASENIGIVECTEDTFEFGLSVRGALDSYVQDLADEIVTLANLFNFDAITENWYPAWDYMEHSPLRDIMASIYKETHDREDLQLYGVHGGLECGIFKQKLPDLDIVAIGPNISDVHSPDEKLDLVSFERTYNFLCKLLENL